MGVCTREGPDGSLLISDDDGKKIWRLRYGA
jgi:glucose/arabinose dehydrogenase